MKLKELKEIFETFDDNLEVTIDKGHGTREQYDLKRGDIRIMMLSRNPDSHNDGLTITEKRKPEWIKRQDGFRRKEVAVIAFGDWSDFV